MAPPVPSRRQRYLTVIVRAIVTAMLAFVLAEMAGRYLTDTFLPTTYTAISEVQLNARWDSTDASPKKVEPDGKYLKSQCEAINSPTMLAPIIQALYIKKTHKGRTSGKEEENQPPDEAAAALENLRQNLRVVPKQSNVLQISVSSNDPQEAADTANAIADIYQHRRNVEDDDLEGSKVPPAQTEPSVHIISRAKPPAHANHHFAHVMTNIFAVIFAIMASSFVEMVMLFRRAGERE